MKILWCAMIAALFAFSAAAADVSGKWSGNYTFENGNGGAAFMSLKQSGTTLSGTAGPGEDQQWTITSGKIQGNTVSIELKSPQDGAIYKIQLTLAGDNLKGDLTATGGDQSMKGKLDLAR